MSGPPPLVWQLDDPARVIDVSGGASRLAGPMPPDHDDLRGVLFLGRGVDPEADRLQAALARQGLPSARATVDSVGMRLTDAGLRWRVGGRTVDPTLVWVRHFSARAAAPARQSIVDRYRGDAWRALLGQLAAVATVPVLGTGPGLLRQLRAARRLGLATPRTVVTTQPALDVAAIRTGRVVVKALGGHIVEGRPGRLHAVFAQIVARAEVAQYPSTVDSPLVLQEYVEHDRELRVYFVGGRIVGYQVDKSGPAAPWLDESATAVTAVPVPAPVVAMTRALAEALGCRYAAFDILLTPTGPVFLEANPDGDWRWFERRAGNQAVTTAATAMLLAVHGRLPLAAFLAS